MAFTSYEWHPVCECSGRRPRYRKYTDNIIGNKTGRVRGVCNHHQGGFRSTSAQE